MQYPNVKDFMQLELAGNVNQGEAVGGN